MKRKESKNNKQNNLKYSKNKQQKEEEYENEELEQDEEEVFNLSSKIKHNNKNKFSSESESDDSDNNSEDNEDSEEDEDDYEKTDLDQLVDNLPSDIRQRVIKGYSNNDNNNIDSDDNEDDDDSNDEENEKFGWGKKSNYYSGDTADLEIGQDHGDAEDEEAAAKELQKEQLSKRQEIDYVDSDEDIEIQKSKKLTKEIEKKSQNVKSGKMIVEKLERNINNLTKKQRLDILKSESPEMLGLVEELNDKFKDLKERIEPLKLSVDKLSKLQPVDDELCLYLQSKQQLLSSYCINILFYLMLKADGVSVQAHPVMKQLLKLRYLMEKMRQLDSKMKHQIDRLLSSGANNDSMNEKTTSSRPNISSLLEAVSDDDNELNDDSDDDSDNNNNRNKTNISNKGVYRPPKLNAVPYKDDKDITQLEEKIQRKKKKIKNSEILEALREEFGHAPEQSSSSGLGHLTKEQHDIDNEMEERRKFEEERFVRLTLSKKDKKALKKRREMSFNPSQELIADMGDIDDLETLTTLTNNLQSIDPNSKLTNSRISKVGGVNSESLTNALKKAVNVFNQDDIKNKKSKKESTTTNKLRSADEEDFSTGLNNKNKSNNYNHDDDDDDNDGFDYGDDDNDNDNDESQYFENTKQSKRRRAPESDFNNDNNEEEDDEDNLFEEFSKKKKEYISKKSKHYQIDQRIGGHEDIIEDPIDHRAASYEIMSNRGLRPHRKKVNRNPRVKKREAYDKAVLKRKSQVREGDNSGSNRVSYGGELTGIKSNLSRSRRFNS